MHFYPVIIDNLFSDEDRKKLISLVHSDDAPKNWEDSEKQRVVKKFPELEQYFSKKLEPLAREIFKDQSLTTSYSVYLDYNRPTSRLDMHLDNNACTYSIDYSISANTPWGLIVGGEEFFINPGQGIAFMGGHDRHGRNPMPDAENNRVEVVMFHFVPEDHWYITEGPDYIYELEKKDLLSEGDSYHLSPKYKKTS